MQRKDGYERRNALSVLSLKNLKSLGNNKNLVLRLLCNSHITSISLPTALQFHTHHSWKGFEGEAVRFIKSFRKCD